MFNLNLSMKSIFQLNSQFFDVNYRFLPSFWSLVAISLSSASKLSTPVKSYFSTLKVNKPGYTSLTDLKVITKHQEKCPPIDSGQFQWKINPKSATADLKKIINCSDRKAEISQLEKPNLVFALLGLILIRFSFSQRNLKENFQEAIWF